MSSGTSRVCDMVKRHLHLYANSPRYGTRPPVSRTGHQISHINIVVGSNCIPKLKEFRFLKTPLMHFFISKQKLNKIAFFIFVCYQGHLTNCLIGSPCKQKISTQVSCFPENFSLKLCQLVSDCKIHNGGRFSFYSEQGVRVRVFSFGGGGEWATFPPIQKSNKNLLNSKLVKCIANILHRNRAVFSFL